eukprot:scaffold125333_cov21-Tisochrysis_lutea.AAC.2
MAMMLLGGFRPFVADTQFICELMNAMPASHAWGKQGKFPVLPRHIVKVSDSLKQLTGRVFAPVFGGL